MAFFANLTSWLAIAVIKLNLIHVRVQLWWRAKGMQSSHKADLRSRLHGFTLRAILANTRAEYDEAIRLVGLLDAIPVTPDAPGVPDLPKSPEPDKPTSNDLVQLRMTIAKQFNRDELCTLCFDLGIQYENLPETLDGMARELVVFCERTGRIRDLVGKCSERRPTVPWEGEYERALY